MRTRLLAAAALITMSLAIPPGVAAAAGVANDEPTGAIAVTALPYSNSQSTSKATANDADGGCGAGGQDQATVWYTITVQTATRVLIDTAGSAYTTGINVYSAGPGSEILDCVADSLAFDAAAGQTYSVMIADIDGGRNGGRLAVSISVAPPAIELGLALDPGVTLSATGSLIVTGTVSCSTTADFVDVGVDAAQTTGRFTTRGFANASIGCNAGDTVPWSVEIVADSGTFGSGSTTINADAFGCDATSCDEATATETVRVRR